MTFSTAEWLISPAELAAMQVYSPACSALTASILKELIFGLMRITVIPFTFSIAFFRNSQLILTGKAPLVTTHWMDVRSPSFMASSPKSNGKICGGTIRGLMIFHLEEDWDDQMKHLAQRKGRSGENTKKRCPESVFRRVHRVYVKEFDGTLPSK